MASTNDLKNGMTLDIEGQLWTVVEFQHVKPGKGPAFVRTKLKSVLSGKVVDRTYNAGVKIDIAILEKREMQYLYKEGDDFVFMDTESYDQINISPRALGEASDYLVEGSKAIIAQYRDEIVSVEIAVTVELNIALTEPGIQGDRVSGARKPATLETGKVIQVPLFVNIGDRVKVDTRSGDYITRV